MEGKSAPFLWTSSFPRKTSPLSPRTPENRETPRGASCSSINRNSHAPSAIASAPNQRGLRSQHGSLHPRHRQGPRRPQAALCDRRDRHERPRRKKSAHARADESSGGRRGVAGVPGRRRLRRHEVVLAEQRGIAQRYHWNTNAETYYLIGEAMGKSMLRLLSSK